jgi:predicted component of type VI protein secretion system
MNLKLLVVQGKPAGKTLLFGPGDYYLGRGPECNIRFNSDWVSRQHCLLRVQGDGAVLRDLGSRNGTLVNGQLLSGDHRLASGELIQIGQVVFEVSLAGPAAGMPTVQPGEIIRPPDQDSAIKEPPLNSTSHHPAVPGRDLGETQPG